MSQYLQPYEVGTLPGRLQSLWSALAAETQARWIIEASAQVDEIVGQLENPATGAAAGLMAQSGLVSTQFIDSPGNFLLLPNKPITAITTILVKPPYATSYTLPLATTPGDGQTLMLTGGQGLRYLNTASLPETVPQRGPYPFLPDDIVSITYNCGFTTIPSAVKNATRNILEMNLFAEADNPGGAESIGERGARVQFGTKGNSLLMSACGLLAPYQVRL